MRFRTAILLSFVALFGARAAIAEVDRGKVTNLPIPRFVSLKAEEGNARRGPSLSHRIDWVFQRRNMPLRVTGEHGHWRRVQDRDGQGGWVHYSLISGARHVIVENDMTPLYVKPDQASTVNAYVESGVVARLGKCDLDWCRVTAKGSKGWVAKRVLWGVLPEEMRE